jgi:hypothetical protein
MTGIKRIVLSAICGLPLALAGCAEDHYHARRERVVVVEEEPPPVRREVVGVAPSRDHIWVEGHWVRRGRGGWDWEPGYWVARPRPRAEWVPGHWVRERGGWLYVDGHWR